MKKTIAIALAIIMAGLTLFAGCKDTQTEATKAPENTQSAQTQAPAATDKTAETTPDAYAEKLELTMLKPMDLSAYQENTIVETTLEEMFNVDIKMIAINAWDEDKVNVTLSSGTIPDIFVRWSAADFYSQGITRKITKEMIQQYMPFCYSVIEENFPNIGWAQVTDPVTGDLVGVPMYAANGSGKFAMGVRHDWLENVGINKAPATIDELHEALQKLTFNDPDQNGINDTYGIGGCNEWTPMGWLYITIMGAYGVAPLKWTEEDGQVVPGYITENYKEALKTLNSWYEEGLIDPEFSYLKQSQWFAKAVDGKFGFFDCYSTSFTASSTGDVPGLLWQQYPDLVIDEIFILEGPDPSVSGNTGYGVYNGWAMMFGNAASDEKVIRAMQMQDTINSDPTLVRMCLFGIEGETYTINEDKQCVAISGVDTNAYGVGVGYWPFYGSWEVVTDILENTSPMTSSRSLRRFRPSSM